MIVRLQLIVLTLFFAINAAAENLSDTEIAHNYAIEHGIPVIKTVTEVKDLVISGYLQPLIGDRTCYDTVTREMKYPFALPQTVQFIEILCQQYITVCPEILYISSAVRSDDYNATINGASPDSAHRTGMSVDITKSKNIPCKNWLRSQLDLLQSEGMIVYHEAFSPDHFHTTVLPHHFNPEVAMNARPYFHIVKRGETLHKIAQTYGFSTKDIASHNNIVNAKLLQVGQKLLLPTKS